MSKRSRIDRAEAHRGSRMEPEPQLSDEQWSLIADLFPDAPPSEKGGRPRRTARECVEGILWVLRSGARWRDLPRISLTTDVLASIQSLDRGWSMEAGLGPPLAQDRPRWWHPLGRRNGRRDVFLGEKRGLCVGQPARQGQQDHGPRRRPRSSSGH